MDTSDENKLDELMRRQGQEGQRLGDAFSDAAKAQSGQAGKFDDMFSDALEEAKNDEDDKPRNPFDLE